MNNKVDNTYTLAPYVAEYQNIRKKFVNGDFKGAASLFDKLYNGLVKLHGQEKAKKVLGEIINKVGVDHIDFVIQDVLSRNFTAIISDEKRYLNNFRTILEGVDKAPLRMQNPNLDQFLVNGAKLNTEVLSGLLRHYDNLYGKNSTAAQVNLLMNLQDHILKNNPSDSKSIKLIQYELYKLFLHKKQAVVDDMIENPTHALFIMKNPNIMDLLFNEANHEQLNQLIDKCKPELGRAIVIFNLLGDLPGINVIIREKLPQQDNAEQRKLILSIFSANEGHLNESTLAAYLRLYDNPADKIAILKTMLNDIKTNANGKYPKTGLDIRRLFTGYSSRQNEDIQLLEKAEKSLAQHSQRQSMSDLTMPSWTSTTESKIKKPDLDKALDVLGLQMAKFEYYIEDARSLMKTDLRSLDINGLKEVIESITTNQQHLKEEKRMLETQINQVGTTNIPAELNNQYAALTKRIDATQANLTNLRNIATAKLALPGYQAALRNINAMTRPGFPKDKSTFGTLRNNLLEIEKYPPYQSYIERRSQKESLNKNEQTDATNKTKAVPEEHLLSPEQMKAYNDIAELRDRLRKFDNCKIPLVKSYYESRVHEQLNRMNIPYCPFQKLIKEIGEFKTQSTAAPAASKK
ncbi:MAG: hypothetical protein K2X50_06420 [Gammaproteobacteria bacterium]|nr:hypothetical protein [Gammaproteobacteria bacterium]